MPDREKERSARNRDHIARMSVAPTKPQFLAELDDQLGNALDLATAADLPSFVRLLRQQRRSGPGSGDDRSTRISPDGHG